MRSGSDKYRGCLKNNFFLPSRLRTSLLSLMAKGRTDFLFCALWCIEVMSVWLMVLLCLSNMSSSCHGLHVAPAFFSRRHRRSQLQPGYLTGVVCLYLLYLTAVPAGYKRLLREVLRRVWKTLKDLSHLR